MMVRMINDYAALRRQGVAVFHCLIRESYDGLHDGSQGKRMLSSLAGVRACPNGDIQGGRRPAEGAAPWLGYVRASQRGRAQHRGDDPE
eukprot:5638086-Pleurochrysis_carterae.AAC.2